MTVAPWEEESGAKGGEGERGVCAAQQLIRSTTSEKIAYRKANRGDGPEFDDPMEGCGLLVARGALPLVQCHSNDRPALDDSKHYNCLEDLAPALILDYPRRTGALERTMVCGRRRTGLFATSLPSCTVEMPGSVTVKNVCESGEAWDPRRTGNFFAVVTSPCQTVSKSPKNGWRTEIAGFLKLHRVAARTVERTQLKSAGPTSSQFVSFQEASVGCGSSAAPASNQGNPFDIAFDRKVGNWAVPWGSGVGAFRWRRCQSSPLRVRAPEALRPNCGEALVFRFFPSATVAMDFPSNGGQEPGKACWGVANPWTPRPQGSSSQHKTAELLCLCECPTKGFFCVVPRWQCFLLRWAGCLGLRCAAKIWLVEGVSVCAGDPPAGPNQAGVSLNDDGALLSGALCPFRLGFFDFSIKCLDLLPDLVAGFGLWVSTAKRADERHHEHPISLVWCAPHEVVEVVDDSELARTKHQETFPVLSKVSLSSWVATNPIALRHRIANALAPESPIMGPTHPVRNADSCSPGPLAFLIGRGRDGNGSHRSISDLNGCCPVARLDLSPRVLLSVGYASDRAAYGYLGRHRGTRTRDRHHVVVVVKSLEFVLNRCSRLLDLCLEVEGGLELRTISSDRTVHISQMMYFKFSNCTYSKSESSKGKVT
ncbi:uncharacterized protein CLUP02_09990 [Colletotrichum lupini]|uniref:Uncharacterized protein n=1 Tax=Colletotrichum lupini TaxID=145971 RepID=A0A9Q8SW00_9PEZI|nr:uncharacterized protein CLUP02_09990 [Colletotrichum lupini]UQC84493.1 hypothetical protein CLUP02_09990 [Colletotrichum lupini]